jgi:hypothetical protein
MRKLLLSFILCLLLITFVSAQSQLYRSLALEEWARIREEKAALKANEGF